MSKILSRGQGDWSPGNMPSVQEGDTEFKPCEIPVKTKTQLGMVGSARETETSRSLDLLTSLVTKLPVPGGHPASENKVGALLV